MSDDDELVTVDRARDATIAELHANLLRGDGIDVYIPGAALTDEWAASQRVLGLLGTDLQVPRRDLERARTLLAIMREGAAVNLDSPAPSWTCTNCQETIEAQFSSCWRCGAERSP